MTRSGHIAILLFMATALVAADKNPPLIAKQVPVVTPAPPPKLEHLQQFHAEGVLGMPVVDGKGDTIGTIVNVLIDQKGAPSAAVIEFQGFLGLGNREIAVAWNALGFSRNGGGVVVTETLDADRLKALPQYIPDESSVPVATRPHAAPAAP
jgi:hypothetical protein